MQFLLLFYLYIKKLGFRNALKRLKKYYIAKNGSIYSVYCNISYNHLESCDQKLAKYTLYIGPHKLEEYRCEVNSYQIRLEKIYIYIMATYVNYQGNYQIISIK